MNDSIEDFSQKWRPMKIAILLLFACITSGCGSLPQNDSETRKWAHESSDVNTKQYVVPGLNLESAETRLRGFAKKCLSIDVYTTSGTGSEYGGSSTYSSHFKPRVVPEKNRVSLFLQRIVKNSNMVGVPASGRYDFLAEITPGKNGVSVFSARLRNIWGGAGMDVGNILDDLESWLRGSGHFCPKLQ